MSKPIMDISHHQKGKFDWAKIKKAVEGVIIRVQYGSSVEDGLYKTHARNAAKYGVPFGFYAYGHFTSINDARVEADVFLNRVNAIEKEISQKAKFLMLDTEKDTIASCGTKDVAIASQAFIDRLKNAGRRIGFYVSHELYDNYGLNKVRGDFLMLPRYGKDNGKPDLKPDYPCDLWQYSQHCKIDGYDGLVDLSLLNGSKNAAWFFGAPVEDKPKPPSKPTTADVYVVKSGDTLSKIGLKFGVTVAKLADLNGLKPPYTIYPGQKIKLKGAAKQAPKPQAIYYIVKSGDMLDKIAAKFGTTADKINKLNANIVHNDKIFAGQKIRVK
jgi:LysM repeat protein/GH25 family lysozyme M1 (1,4-beta-N-acetylmuramidase)